MGFFGEMFGMVERCPHGAPKGERCGACDAERKKSSVLESLKELMDLECPHKKDYRDCDECKRSGWRPPERKRDVAPPAVASDGPRASGPSSYEHSDSVLESLKELFCPHNKDWRDCDECKRSGWKPGDPR